MINALAAAVTALQQNAYIVPSCKRRYVPSCDDRMADLATPSEHCCNVHPRISHRYNSFLSQCIVCRSLKIVNLNELVQQPRFVFGADPETARGS
jgi:hypothetical protein